LEATADETGNLDMATHDDIKEEIRQTFK